MPRKFSLRGKVDTNDNQVTANHLIFDYASTDRTRAWRVSEAYIWPVEPRAASSVGSDGFMLLVAALGTDSGKFNHDELSDPSENRLFAWAQQTYNTRDAPTDFITPNGVPLGQMRMLVDPDTLITKQIYLNIGTATDVDESASREWGYLIILEERKVSAAESLFQQLKGIGQDIDT